MYQRIRTYVYRIIGGSVQPGVEPEVDTAGENTIQEIGWFDLRDPARWDSLGDGIILWLQGR